MYVFKQIGSDQMLETAVRALRNPELFKHEHFRQAAIAIAAGVAIHIIVQIPVCAERMIV